jgi:hypothetical protein
MDPADETFPEQVAGPVTPLPLASPTPRKRMVARPEMSRQERVIFTVYVVLGLLIALFLAATGVLWWLGE